MKPVRLDINEVCFKEGQDISNTHEKSRESHGFTERCRFGRRGVMHTNFEYLSCGEVETLGYLRLSNMRYDERTVVTEGISTRVLQRY